MDVPIGELIARRARDRPDAVLVVDARTGEELTACDLDAAASTLAARLRRRGVARDDVVTIAMPTSPALVVAVVAAWKAGATPLVVCPSLPDDERAQLDSLARPAVVVGTSAPGSDIPEIDATEFREPDTPGDPPPGLWASSWKVSTSSGSTGRRKLIRSTTPAHFDPTRPIAPFLPTTATQLVTGDLWHSAAFTYAFRGLMTDHRLVLASGVDAADLPAIIRRHHVTWTCVSPSMVRRLVRLGGSRRGMVPTLQTLVHIGAPCPAADKRALLDWLGPERVVEVYAGTEAIGLTAITGTDWLRWPGSVGTGVSGTEIAVRDDQGRDLPPGVVGTVWMRRAGSPPYRYVGGVSARTDDGWDTAGDLGHLDAEGHLFLAGRGSDRRRCGDTQVDLARVDDDLLGHDDILECLTAVGSSGDALDAEITVTADCDGLAVVAAVQAVLGRHCRPGRITLRHGLIRDSAGKARRPV